jgi:YD repeat-containing protein
MNRGVGALRLKRDLSNGLIKADTLGNITDSMSYTTLGELSRNIVIYGSTTLFQTTYIRDSLSRITSLTETVQGTTKNYKYRYDSAGRLVEVKRNDTTISIYTYDPNGNRIAAVRGVAIDSGAYDAQDRLVTYGNASYVYTKAGNLHLKITGTDTTSYRYDAYGNLISVRMPDGNLIEYVIDATNRRIGRKVNGIFTAKYVYSDDLKPAAMLDSAGNVIERYVYATHENVPEYIIRGDTTYRVVTDHLGSVRLVINSTTGAIVQRVDFDESGRNVRVDRGSKR